MGAEIEQKKILEAIVYLADMMEDPTHDMYKVKSKVLDILGLVLTPSQE